MWHMLSYTRVVVQSLLNSYTLNVASLNKQYYEISYDSPSLKENKTKLKTNPQTKIYRQKIKKNNNKTINTHTHTQNKQTNKKEKRIRQKMFVANDGMNSSSLDVSCPFGIAVYKVEKSNV